MNYLLLNNGAVLLAIIYPR